MDTETIEDDIFNFIDIFFGESLEIVDNNFNFLDEHSLIDPKESYFFTLKFLDTTMTHFSNLNRDFGSETLKKIYRDVKNLKKQYEIHLHQVENIEDIFNNKFIKKATLFNAMKKEILNIKNSDSFDEIDQESIEIIKQQYQQMKKIYFRSFQEIFKEQNDEILSSLKIIINFKAYYFDKLLWEEANRSQELERFFKDIKSEKAITSRIYIANRLAVDLPYTDDYKYLQKCIKVYR